MEELNLLNDFPKETLVIICSFANSGSLVKLSLTCKYLQELIHDNLDYIVYNATDFRCFAKASILQVCGIYSKKKLWNVRNWHEWGFGQEEIFTHAILRKSTESELAPKYNNPEEIMELATALEAYMKNRGIKKTAEVINSRFIFTGSDIYDREEDLFIDHEVIRCQIKKYKNVMNVAKCEGIQVYLLNCEAPNIRILYNAKELVLPKIFRLNRIYDFSIVNKKTGFGVSVNILASKYTALYNSKGILTNLRARFN